MFKLVSCLYASFEIYNLFLKIVFYCLKLSLAAVSRHIILADQELPKCPDTITTSI